MASIQALSSSVFDSAKISLQIRTFLHVGTFSCAAASIFSSGVTLYVLAVVAFFAEAFALFLHIQAKDRKLLGQSLIRLNIAKEAFNKEYKATESYLRRLVGKREERKAEKFEVPEYYATEKGGGLETLKQIIQESSFWSSHLYEKSRNASFRNFVFIIIISLVILVSLLSYVQIEQDYSIPRISLMFFMLFPTWERLAQAIEFNRASRSLERIDHTLESDNLSEEDIILLFAEYNIVTSIAPLIPQRIYEREKETLNHLWAERKTKNF